MNRRVLGGVAAGILLLHFHCSDTSVPGASPGPSNPTGDSDAGIPTGEQGRDPVPGSRSDGGGPPDAGPAVELPPVYDGPCVANTPAANARAATDSADAGSGVTGGGIIPVEDEPGPRPYLQTPTDHSMWVSWWTNTGTESKVEFGTGEASLNRTASGTTTELASDASYHLVKLDGLTADTRYWYRVTTGTSVSRVYRFRTLPAPGTKPDHFRFLIIGDHQIIDQPRHTKMVAAARDEVVEKFGGYIEDAIRLNVNVGDQVDVGNVDHWRNLHFKQSALLTPYIPTTTIVGNHETYYDTDLALYKQLFAYEGLDYAGIAPRAEDSEKYYALRAANLLFIMTDTEHTTGTAGTEQASYVERLVTKASGDAAVDWIITLGHRPYQAEQYVGDISTWIRNTVAPILTRTPKSIAVVGAHHHLYARGQLRNDPLYNLISGGTAWDQYWGQSNETDFDDVQKTIDFWPYQIVDADRTKDDVSAETYAMGSPKLGYFPNTLIDCFHRRKNQSAPKKPALKEAPKQPITLPFTFHSTAYASAPNEPYNSTQFQVAPSSAFATLEIDLYRDYEDLFGTTGPNGTPKYWWADKNKGVDIFALPLGQGRLPNGAHVVRVRHRDRNLEWSAWSDPVAFTVTGSTSGAPTVSMQKSRYPKGSPVDVQWANGPANAKDWVGIYVEGQTPGGPGATAWTYTPAASGSTTFNLTNSDLYWVNLFENDGYKELAKRVPFYYGDIPVLQTDRAKYDVGQTVTVKLTNGPALARDWVGIYKAGQTPGAESSTAWLSATGATGSFDFASLKKGFYFAGYFLKNEYFEPGSRVAFQVGDQIAALSVSSASFPASSPVTFHFSDGPATAKDYVGIFREGATPGVDKLVSYLYVDGKAAGSVTFAAGALAAGKYFAALYTNDSYTEVSNRVVFAVTP
ncbi:fibronectin type III domain-containing protein [Pendulispora albinea]|uniref:Fibronectin type III domain-containing protein n=1 Tax=Pendulispora albinea TaxID=2741071 RepID=A0ABZ2M582_9BACT